MAYELAADLTALTHFAFLLFIIFGALLGRRKRVWRYLHLASMVYGVMIEVFYWHCPLTYLEQHLREKAGAESFQGGFIAHYLNEIIYINAPQWSLILAAVVVLAVNLGLYVCWHRLREDSPSPTCKKPLS